MRSLLEEMIAMGSALSSLAAKATANKAAATINLNIYNTEHHHEIIHETEIKLRKLTNFILVRGFGSSVVLGEKSREH